MSKFIENVKFCLELAAAIMLLIYIFMYRRCSDELIELKRENTILKKYIQQELQINNMNIYTIRDDIYVI